MSCFIYVAYQEARKLKVISQPTSAAAVFQGDEGEEEPADGEENDDDE
jgi:hypothetical protein